MSCFVWFCLCAIAGAAEAKNNPIPAGATVPSWPKPTALVLSSKVVSARSQDLEVIHSQVALHAFQVRLAGESMALGQSGTMIGYVAGGEMRWFGLANVAGAKRTLKVRGKSVFVSLEGRDPDGAVWKMQQQFSAGPVSDAISITTEVTVDQDRSVAFLPMLMIFPGAGSFGAAKARVCSRVWNTWTTSPAARKRTSSVRRRSGRCRIS